MDTAFEDLCITDQDRKVGSSRMDKRKKVDQDGDGDQDREFISKNLEAERRRRKKLNDRQLELRSLVPIITNMNKATIITDAIAYIEELKTSVEELTDQILQMEAADEDKNTTFEEIINDDEHETKIATEVEVNHICGTKMWIKIVVQKKRGRITKLMEAINMLGFHLTDISITTSRQAVLFTSSAEGVHGGVQDAEQIKKFLLEIVRSI